MSILSSIKSAAKKVVSVAKGAYNTVKSTLSDGFGKVGSQVASVYNAVTPSGGNTVSYSADKYKAEQAKNAKNTTVTGKAGGTTYYNNYTPTDTSGRVLSNYVTAGGINTSGGSGSSSYGPSLPNPVTAEPRTLQRTSVNNTSSSSLTSSPEFISSVRGLQGSTLTSNNLASPVGSLGALPSTGGGSTGVTGIDTTKLQGGMADIYKYNDKTGQSELIPENTGKVDDKIQTYRDLFNEFDRPSVYDDRQVRQAMEERNQLRQQLQGPTSELNSVIAKQQQDLLQLRATGAQEGVTEAVYGQQSNAVNYGAAIRALPLQASIANIQGQLDLAQDYLKELTAIKSDQIDRQWEKNKMLFNSISGILEKEDDRAYKELTAENDRKRTDEKDLVSFKEKVMFEAMKNGARDSVISRINEATDRGAVIQSAGQYLATPETQLTQLDNGDTVLIDKRTGRVVKNIGGAKPVSSEQGVLGTLPTSIQGKVIGIATKTQDNPIVKRYNSVVDSIALVNGIDSKSKNPADHQTIVYAFAKALDSDSAVKEGEYDTIKKYSQSTISKYGKEITNAINGTGFLSEGAIKNIQTAMTNNYDSRKPQYEKYINEQKRVVNNIAGKDVSNEIFVDFNPEVKTETNTNVAPETQLLRSKYEY